MPIRGKGEEIRLFILKNVEEHHRDIATFAATHFRITRQAVGRHLGILIEDGKITAQGKTRNRKYALVTHSETIPLKLSDHGDEEKVWHSMVAPHFEDCRENIRRICYYGFTEMFNNVIDHSEGNQALVTISKNPVCAAISIKDDGIGIFEKIKTRLNLPDYRQAILELSKGKLTTDPKRHSGQGIFFTSRAFDRFCILSSGLYFGHRAQETEDWLIEIKKSEHGTYLDMEIATDSTTTLRNVFDQFTSGEADDFSFSRTHVPLSLARFGNEDLMSRSQAKRILARFDRFAEVFLDFKGVNFVGQGFADEIFRVFRSNNPGIRLIHVNANEQILRMIQWVEASSPYQPEHPVNG